MAIAKNCEDFPRSDGDTFKKKLEAGNLNTSENDQLFKRLYIVFLNQCSNYYYFYYYYTYRKETC